MNLGLLFNTLGALIFDGVPEDAKIELQAYIEGGSIQSIWIREGYIPTTIVISGTRPPRRGGQKVLWEKSSNIYVPQNEISDRFRPR